MKKNGNEWLQCSTSVTLYQLDKRILESNIEWLNDNIINGAQVLLKQQFPTLTGFMSPQLSKRKELFTPVLRNTSFIQVLNIGESHWITVSNIDPCNHTLSNSAVSVYDSGSPARVNRETRRMICSIMKPATDQLHFDLINIMLQPNGSDCGVLLLHVQRN